MRPQTRRSENVLGIAIRKPKVGVSIEEFEEARKRFVNIVDGQEGLIVSDMVSNFLFLVMEQNVSW